MCPSLGKRERSGGSPAPEPSGCYLGLLSPKPRVHPKRAASEVGFRGSPPRTRVTFCTHKKSPKKRRETRAPFICLIGRYQTLPLRSHRTGVFSI